MKKSRAEFATEADLCTAFIAAVPEGWTAYPETGGFDILLVRSDGAQVGIEAKLRLNAEVVSQIVEPQYDPCGAGPDFRAVLVPYGTKGRLAGICGMLGITAIEMYDDASWAADTGQHYRKRRYYPDLPRLEDSHWAGHQNWLEWAPAKRLKLPAYIPDVGAGHSAPVRLSDWKIKAIKIAIIVETRGFVTRQDFKAIGIDYRRWIEPYTGWLARGANPGFWIAGPHIGTFKAQHPTNYEQIAADAAKWMPAASLLPAPPEVLLV